MHFFTRLELDPRAFVDFVGWRERKNGRMAFALDLGVDWTEILAGEHY